MLPAAPSARRLAPLALLLFLGALLAGPTTRVGAVQHGKHVLQRDRVIEQSYPAITQYAPMTSFRSPDPGECATASYCDTIPLDVVFPEVPAGDEVIMDIEVFFDDQNGMNNLETFLWDNKQLKAKYGTNAPGDPNWDARDTDYTRVGVSVGPNNPEKITITTPDIGEYNLVVHNQDGLNNGYRVKIQMIVDESEPVYEYQEERGGGAASAEEPEDESVSVADLEMTESEEEAAVAAGTTEDSGLAPAFGSADSSLSGIEEREFDTELSAPALRTATPVAVAKPDPPSGIVLFLWLVLMPALIGAAAAAWIRRQRLVLAFPA